MFNNYISLGCSCGTASSLAKYGLRSFSGPFDWCITDLRGILHFIETNFSDFLFLDNIKLDQEKPNVFHDIKYGIDYLHDVRSNFLEEYQDIYNKYLRRIKKLLSEIKDRTCFIRAVKTEEELKFIEDNHNYINEVIKKSNIHNRIIFLIPYYMKVPPKFKDQYYLLNINVYQGFYRGGLRSHFDSNEEFISYCISNFSEEKRKDNLIFDMQAEMRILERHASLIDVVKRMEKEYDNAYKEFRKYQQLAESRCQRLMLLLNMDLDKIKLPQKIDIYGAGDIGKSFYNKVKNKCDIGCFIDAKPMEGSYDHIPIIKTGNYQAPKERKIVVIPTYALDEIVSDLVSLCKAEISNIISLESLIK